MTTLGNDTPQSIEHDDDESEEPIGAEQAKKNREEGPRVGDPPES
jgi:hypothetical protein